MIIDFADPSESVSLLIIYTLYILLYVHHPESAGLDV